MNFIYSARDLLRERSGQEIYLTHHLFNISGTLRRLNDKNNHVHIGGDEQQVVTFDDIEVRHFDVIDEKLYISL